MEQSISALEDTIQYHFKDKSLLVTALTHSSYANERRPSKDGKTVNNERLEFLGDAVLEIISSDFLYHRYEKEPEGSLTKMRASLVCEPALARVAAEIGLPSFILLGKGETKTGGRNRPSIMADALEAMIGALYLDGGMEAASAFIRLFMLSDIDKRMLFVDCKTMLQEFLQARSEEPVYRLIDESGPAHHKLFVVEVLLNGVPIGCGRGRSKKSAQQEAAKEALQRLKQDKQCI